MAAGRAAAIARRQGNRGDVDACRPGDFALGDTRYGIDAAVGIKLAIASGFIPATSGIFSF